MGQLETDIKTVWTSLEHKRIIYSRLESYYEGNHPTVYLTERLRDIFIDLKATFTENWCAVVIDACKERVNMTGITSDDETIQAQLDALWDANDGNLESDDVHLNALIFGEAFVIIDVDEAGRIDWYYNDPRFVHVEYDQDSPRRKRMAGKMWVDNDGYYRMTLYYPDRIWHLVSDKKAKSVTSPTSFKVVPEEPDGVENTLGGIPVFHFRTARKPMSELSNIIELQNGINKLLADMMVAAEYSAFRQRYIIANIELKGKLGSEPGGLWILPAATGDEQATTVGEFSPTELSNYLDAIDRLAGALAIISRTPKHYLFTQGGTPSGESLMAMESPLNKKAQDRIDRFIPVWRELFVFMLQLQRFNVSDSDLTPRFDAPESVQPMTNATITKTYVEAGVPLEFALEWEGRTKSEVEAVVKALADAKAEAARQQQLNFAAAAAALDTGIRQPGVPEASNVMNPPDVRQ